MPFVIAKKDGKRFGLPNALFTAEEINRLRNDYHCYTIVNTTSRRVSRVGAACRKPTPENLWGGSFLEKLFGKKKPKRHPMSKRMYFVPGAGKNPMTRRGELVTMGRARRRRRRRR